MKQLLPNGLVAAAVMLSGCYADPTPAGVGDEASIGSARVQRHVASLPLEDEGVVRSVREVEVEILTGEINLNSKGKVKVVIPTTGVFDASEVDPETVTLGDGQRADTPVLRKKSGKLMARLEDDDGDGDLDLVLQFAVRQLVANGDLTGNSTELVLEAATHAGPAVRGSAAVAPRSLEPKTLLPSSRMDTSLRIALLGAVPAAWQEV